MKIASFLHKCRFSCSSAVEDCEEAFVKNPDGHPLVLYLKTDTDHTLTGPTRQLLERVNAADKASKIKVCCVNFASITIIYRECSTYIYYTFTLHASQILPPSTATA